MKVFGFHKLCDSVFLDSFLDEQNNLYIQSYNKCFYIFKIGQNSFTIGIYQIIFQAQS